ncbi:hypothetical protein D9613_009419 [Agrocybe pediades]|uniref:Uncharacterized protein n=1 Tax=Agrocybe pediades TaxID=84607 RepID=A0A8H4VUA8_9AGAR|nr:hypothetical protein D9613_009419 [Agrocybe pediades]
MVILFAISACVSCVIMAVFLSTFEATALAIPGGRFCVSSNPKVKYFHVLWIPMLAFETFLCTLAIIRGTQMRRSLGPFSFYKSSQRLAHVLFRDSIIYFIAIGATYLTSLLVWTFGAEALQETPLGFAIAFPCVIANRLVLNIRSTARAQDQAVHVDCNTTQGFNLSGSSGEAVTGPLVFSAKSYLSTGAAISTHPV